MRQKAKKKLPGERNRDSVESPFLGTLHILKMIPPSLSEKYFHFFGSDRAIFSIFFPDSVRARILLYDPGNKDDTVIVRTILEIGHCLNLRGVAEGVENHSQLAFLRQVNEIFEVNLTVIDSLVEADRDLQQLLVAERSMIFADVRSEVFSTLENEYRQNMQQAEERWEKFKAVATNLGEEEKQLISRFEKAREEWKEVSLRIVEGRRADTREGRREALDLSLGKAKEKFEQMREYIDQLTGMNLNMAEQSHLEANRVVKRTIVVNSTEMLPTCKISPGSFMKW